MPIFDGHISTKLHGLKNLILKALRLLENPILKLKPFLKMHTLGVEQIFRTSILKVQHFFDNAKFLLPISNKRNNLFKSLNINLENVEFGVNFSQND